VSEGPMLSASRGVSRSGVGGDLESVYLAAVGSDVTDVEEGAQQGERESKWSSLFSRNSKYGVRGSKDRVPGSGEDSLAEGGEVGPWRLGGGKAMEALRFGAKVGAKARGYSQIPSAVL
jgi:hypothetical protein